MVSTKLYIAHESRIPLDHAHSWAGVIHIRLPAQEAGGTPCFIILKEKVRRFYSPHYLDLFYIGQFIVVFCPCDPLDFKGFFKHFFDLYKVLVGADIFQHLKHVFVTSHICRRIAFIEKAARKKGNRNKNPSTLAATYYAHFNVGNIRFNFFVL